MKLKMQMIINTTGLVIYSRIQGEANRSIDVLSPEYGAINISVRGGMKLTGSNAAATQLFAYSKFCIRIDKGRYYLDSSKVIRIFYELRNDIKSYTLACYLADICRYTGTANQTAYDVSRLMLNSLHYLCSGEKSCDLIKSIFELRFMADTGYIPNVIGCAECFKYDGDDIYLLIKEGKLLCSKHFKGNEDEYHVRLSPILLHTIRFIVLCDLERVFNFRISEKVQNELSPVAEKYFLEHIPDKYFPCLDYYHTL